MSYRTRSHTQVRVGATSTSRNVGKRNANDYSARRALRLLNWTRKTGNAGGTTNGEGRGKVFVASPALHRETTVQRLGKRLETALRFRERPRGWHGLPVRVRDARMSCYLNHRGAHCTQQNRACKGQFELFSRCPLDDCYGRRPVTPAALSRGGLRAGDRPRRYSRRASAPSAVPPRTPTGRPVVRRRIRWVRSPGSRAPCPR